jgi:phage-related protein
MDRRIIAYKHYFNEFIAALDEGTRDKVLYILALLRTQDRMPVKFIKTIRDGLYELRIEYSKNIYRLFFIFDGNKIVVLFNGFHKKTQKTPKTEIDKALKLKEEYYASKGNK